MLNEETCLVAQLIIVSLLVSTIKHAGNYHKHIKLNIQYRVWVFNAMANDKFWWGKEHGPRLRNDAMIK